MSVLYLRRIFTEGEARGLFSQGREMEDRRKRICLMEYLVRSFDEKNKAWEFRGENIFVSSCNMLAKDYRALTNYEEAEKYEAMAKKAERELAARNPLTKALDRFKPLR